MTIRMILVFDNFKIFTKANEHVELVRLIFALVLQKFDDKRDVISIVGKCILIRKLRTTVSEILVGKPNYHTSDLNRK